MEEITKEKAGEAISRGIFLKTAAVGLAAAALSLVKPEEAHAAPGVFTDYLQVTRSDTSSTLLCLYQYAAGSAGQWLLASRYSPTNLGFWNISKGNDVMTLWPNGNVGIGTGFGYMPTDKLEVSGTVKMTGCFINRGIFYAPHLKDQEHNVVDLSPMFSPLRIYFGTNTNPMVTNVPGLYVGLVTKSCISSDGQLGAFPAAIRAYTYVQEKHGIGNVDVTYAGDFMLVQGTTSFGTGTGGIALHAAGVSGVNGGNVFGAWFQGFDAGNNSGVCGLEINTDHSNAQTEDGKVRGLNVVNFPSDATRGIRDWGVLIAGYGKGLVLSGGVNINNTFTRTKADPVIWVTSQFSTGSVLLSFEANQPEPFAIGLDFTNANISQGKAIQLSTTQAVYWGTDCCLFRSGNDIFWRSPQGDIRLN